MKKNLLLDQLETLNKEVVDDKEPILKLYPSKYHQTNEAACFRHTSILAVFTPSKRRK